ncbi:DNA polymerase Y family protein [Brevundimonas sp.]|uniref:Y-family DNA polymerase n=1 Tax=Brevundimonas sp. TaxID=1871086 RepID=UPI0035AE1821
MSNGRSSPRRRYLAVWFPVLPTERATHPRLGRACAAPADGRPLVLVDKDRGALRITAADVTAQRAGLEPGLALADAQARVPTLEAWPHQPGEDDAFLTRLLEDFGRFTPMIARDAPHGLMLDVTGCAHLFGGEAGLMKQVAARADALGLTTRLALAPTPQAARALARFGNGSRFGRAEARAAVRALSVEALELDPRDATALKRAGLKRIGDLDDRPRAPLAARFRADFPQRLARILGEADIRITPHRPPPPCVHDRRLVEPITETADIERVLGDLLVETTAWLERHGQGGRAFQAGVWRVDGQVRRVTVRTGRPTRDAAAVLRLFREKLAALPAPLDPGFGFDQLRLAVPLIAPLTERQARLQAGGAGLLDPETPDLAPLIDRLTARLGEAAVLRFRSQGSHLPERAAVLVGAEEAGEGVAWPQPAPDDPPSRPLQLFVPPQPVEAVAEAPDGHPFRFRWRRVVHDVARAEGPERIAGEWWRSRTQRTRDYYRVEDREGRRFWLFRQGQYGDAEGPRWFIHGLFP